MSGRMSFDESTDGAMTVVCPLDRAIRVIGGKWKMLVLRSLFVVGPQRYNSFLRTVPGISPKELTRNLRELEHAGGWRERNLRTDGRMSKSMRLPSSWARTCGRRSRRSAPSASS
jgi:DNA-binding HxlR family transcriptional regulator